MSSPWPPSTGRERYKQPMPVHATLLPAIRPVIFFSYRDEVFIPNCDGGGVLNAACTPGDEVHRTITSCTEGSTDSGCKIVEKMQRYSPYILSGGGSVTVSYTCTQTGDSKLPRAVPIVTVSSDNVPYQFMMPGLFNIDASITMPSFSTTRIGEDLHTYIPPAP